MYELHPAVVQCPYCWEAIELLVDCSVESQEYVEDCSVCCRPIIVSAWSSDGELSSVQVRSEDD
jgi:hypothetical protein